MTIVIVGMNSTGIDLYSILKNNNVYLVGNSKEVGMSLKGNKIFIDDIENNIIETINSTIKEKCILYITSDYYNNLIMKESDCNNIWFNKNINYVGIEKKMFAKIQDKTHYHDFLSLYNLKSPLIFDIMNVPVPSDFPLISKYNDKSNGEMIYKSKLIMNENEYEKEIKQSYFNSYIVQQYYSPDQYKQFSYGCFALNGEISVDIYVKQIGQYPRGVSTLVKEKDKIDLNFKTAISKLLKEANYSGFIEFEILRNQNDIVIIDINPRTWGWFYILNMKYKNLEDILLLRSSNPKMGSKKKITWVNYNRLIIQLFKERKISLLKRIRFNKYLFNNLTYIYLYIKKREK